VLFVCRRTPRGRRAPTRVLAACRTDSARIAHAVYEERSVAVAAVSNLKVPPLGELKGESNQLIHREARVRSHLPVDLEDPT